MEKGYIECAHCGFAAIVKNIDSALYFQCPECKKESCLKCGLELHSPLTCQGDAIPGLGLTVSRL